MRSLGIAGPPGLMEGIYYLFDRYDGRILYEHYCSNDSFAPHDLLKGRKERLEEIGEFYLVEQAITYTDHSRMFPEMWGKKTIVTVPVPMKKAIARPVDPLEAMREKILKERVSDEV